MPLVNRSETPDVQWPEWKVDSAPVAPPPPKNEVEALPPGLANGDSWSESQLREAFSALRAGDAYQLSGKVVARVGEGGAGSAKLRAERGDDGSLKLTLSGGGQLKFGAGAEAAVELSAGTTFRFAPGHDAEAADLADALMKGAVVSAAPLGTQVLTSLAIDGTTPGALAARIAGYADHVSALKAEASFEAYAGSETRIDAGFKSWDFGKARAGTEATLGYDVDLEKNTLTVSRTIALEGDFSVQVPAAFKAGVNGSASATLSAEYAMSDEVKRALAGGKLSPAEAWAELSNRVLPDKLIGSVEVESTEKGVGLVAGITTRAVAGAEVELDVAAFLENPRPGQVLEALANTTWSLKSEAGVGPAFAAGGAIGGVKGSVEFSAQHTRTWKTEGLPFAEAMKQLEQPVDDQTLLDTQRALAPR